MGGGGSEPPVGYFRAELRKQHRSQGGTAPGRLAARDRVLLARQQAERKRVAAEAKQAARQEALLRRRRRRRLDGPAADGAGSSPPADQRAEEPKLRRGEGLFSYMRSKFAAAEVEHSRKATAADRVAAVVILQRFWRWRRAGGVVSAAPLRVFAAHRCGVAAPLPLTTDPPTVTPDAWCSSAGPTHRRCFSRAHRRHSETAAE